MSTQLSVMNQALALLAQPVISSTAAVDETTRALNTHWVPAVSTCLEQSEFDFAMKRGELAQSSTPVFGRAYTYTIPADCLRLIWVSPTSNPRDRMSPSSYEIEQGLIYADVSAMFARWVTADAVNSPGNWSETFARYAACELAIRAIKINSGALEMIMKERATAKKESMGIDAAQGPTRFRRAGSWSTANRRRSRHGNSGSGIPEQQ